MDMTCPNCHTRVPVLLDGPAPALPGPGTRVATKPDTADELQRACLELASGARVIRLIPPSEASKARRRPLTEIAAELRQALEEERKAEELSLAADKAQRTAAHYKVDAMRRVFRLRHELEVTAEGRAC